MTKTFFKGTAKVRYTFKSTLETGRTDGSFTLAQKTQCMEQTLFQQPFSWCCPVYFLKIALEGGQTAVTECCILFHFQVETIVIFHHTLQCNMLGFMH